MCDSTDNMTRAIDLMASEYGKQGNLAEWGLLTESEDEAYARSFLDSIKEHGVLPEDMSGFVFMSVSANSGGKESALAKLVDDSLGSKQLEHKPLFIAADVFGTWTDKDNFVPGFDTKKQSKHEYKNIAFQFLSSDAHNIPLAKESVDIIFDRLGAVWYAIQENVNLRRNKKIASWQREDAQEAVAELLKGYWEKLKDEGKIILDASTQWDGTEMLSTAMFLEKIYDNLFQDLTALQFRSEYIGEGDDRLLVLHKNKQKVVGIKAGLIKLGARYAKQ